MGVLPMFPVRIRGFDEFAVKLLPTLFALSVVANAAAFAICVFRPAVAPPILRRFGLAADEAPLAKAKPSDPTRANLRDVKEKIWERLDTSDLRTLVARLRAAGFSPGLIRAMVSAKAWDDMSVQLRPLLARVDATPFWKPRPNDPQWPDADFHEARIQAFRDRSRRLREALGDDFFAQVNGETGALQRREFGDLSLAKIARVQQIVADYREMASQALEGVRGIYLPEDYAKMALLEREKSADLAALLTPAELAEYELRHSPVTFRLRNALTFIDANETEFRAIYEAYRRRDDVLDPSGGSRTGRPTEEYLQQRDVAYRQIVDELNVALGEQRYREFARASTYEFQTLLRLAARENLSRENVIRAFDLREHVARESSRIGDDANLTLPQKQAALRELAQGTRAQLKSVLGSRVAEAYNESASGQWLNVVEEGRIVTFGPDGNRRLMRSLQ